MTSLLASTGIDAPTKLLIGGEWGAGSAAAIPVIDPATEEAIAEVAGASPQDGLDAAARAFPALAPGRDRAPRARQATCAQLAQRMLARTEKRLAESDARAKMASRWANRPPRGPLRGPASSSQFAGEAERIYGDEDNRRATTGTERITVTREPVGPCAR